MQIIALAGSYGSGKSTLAKKLESRLDNAKVISLAETLRQELLAQGLATKQELYDKPTAPYIRKLLQITGAERRHKYGECYWAERWYLQALKYNIDTAICDDMRFLSDYLYMKKSDDLKLYYLGYDDDANYDLMLLALRADNTFIIKPNIDEVLKTWTNT